MDGRVNMKCSWKWEMLKSKLVTRRSGR